MRNNRTFFPGGVFIILIFSCFVQIPLMGQSNPARSPVIELSKGWEYHWGDLPRASNGDFIRNDAAAPIDWRQMESPNHAPERQENHFLWQRVKLPDGNWRDPVVFVAGGLYYFEVYLENRLVYRSENLKGKPIENYLNHVYPRALRFCGTPWHIIPLRGDFQNKEMSIRFYSYSYLIGLFGKVYIGSRADIYDQIVYEDKSRIFTGIISVFMGVFSLIYFLSRRSQKGMLSFGWFALLTGIFIISHSYSKQFVLSHHLVWIILWGISVSFVPVGIVAFVEHLFGKGYKGILRYLWQGHIVISVVLFALSMLFPDQLFDLFLITARVLILIQMIAITVAIVNAVFKGYRNARIFLCGYIFLMVFSSYEVIQSFGIVRSHTSTFHIGMFFLIVSMTIILVRDLNELYRNVKNYSKRLEIMSDEKTQITSELHDGIGGIMTNIGFLVEIAKMDPSSSKAEKALGTISSLSKEGLSEIRSFMRSFDGKETNFDSLIADFRLYGAQIFESHHINFDIKTTNELGQSQPTALFSLNLFRIYKEALVNILKHSNARNVLVEFNILKDVTELTIQDDGIGLKPSNQQGRGIPNMKSRVKEMGGDFSIESKNGVCVRLTIKTPKIPLSRG